MSHEQGVAPRAMYGRGRGTRITVASAVEEWLATRIATGRNVHNQRQARARAGVYFVPFMGPMALEIGAGAESWSPLARVIIGGLFVALVITLFIVPVIYYWLGGGGAARHSDFYSR